MPDDMKLAIESDDLFVECHKVAKKLRPTEVQIQMNHGRIETKQCYCLSEMEYNLEKARFNVKHAKTTIPPLAPAGAEYEDTADLPRLGMIEEFLSHPALSDPNGRLVGLGGHMPLFIKITQRIVHPCGKRDTAPMRNRSLQGEQHQTMKGRKTQLWKATGVWPHWLYHPSEQFYWGWPRASGEAVYSGIFWRLTRQWYYDEDRGDELEAYEKDWTDLYGVQALEEALDASETNWRKARTNRHTVNDLWNNPELLQQHTRQQYDDEPPAVGP